MRLSFIGTAFALSFCLMLPSSALPQSPAKAKGAAAASITPVAAKTPVKKPALTPIPIPNEGIVLRDIAGIASDPTLVAAVKEVIANPPKADPSTWKTMKPKDPAMKPFLTNKIGLALAYKRTRWMATMSIYSPTGQVLGFTNKSPLVRSEKSPLMKGALQGSVLRQKGGNLFSAPIIDAAKPIGVLIVRVDPAKM